MLQGQKHKVLLDVKDKPTTFAAIIYILQNLIKTNVKIINGPFQCDFTSPTS